jgi:F-type H+-transporting ATPase subunit delta
VQNFRYDLPMLITILEDEGALDNFVRDAFRFEVLSRRSLEIEEMFIDPLRGVDEKLRWLDEVMTLYFDTYFCGFLRQLIINEDIRYYEMISDRFFETLTHMRNCLYARVTTAIPLSESQMDRITAKLRELFGKRVFIYSNVSPYFSSGLLIQCGDQMIDLGGRTALEQLNKKLSAK